MRMRTIVLAATVVMGGALVSAPAWAGGGAHLAGGGGGGACAGFGGSASGAETVVLRDLCIDPVGLSVGSGATITVRNDGELPHTFTAVDGSFDTGVLQPGDEAEVTVPDAASAVPVYCTLHASAEGDGMAGLVAVDTGTAAAAQAAAGTSTPWLAAAGGLAAGALGGWLLARRRAPMSPEPVAIETAPEEPVLARRSP